ncbi:LuxR C-terminal-related transcriptional regulator [Pseudenterobacter timonensis]|uniref:LuxR C-terminal-related transcriptional regulator n=1 Tax=Pseudenterobacter timonensis TaxID=1755099 RepID=A0ABV4A7F9_9ENTR
MIMILIASSSGFFLEGLTSALALTQQKDFQQPLVAPHDAFYEALMAHPNVKMLILDYRRYELKLLKLLFEIKRFRPELKIVIIVKEKETLNATEHVLLNTAVDCLLDKNDSLKSMMQIVSFVYSATKVPFDVSHTRLQKLLHPQLNEKEALLFPYIVAGEKNKEIAAETGMDPKLVSYYRTRIYHKYHVHNIVELYSAFSKPIATDSFAV